MSDLQQKVITIQGLEVDETKYKIKDENGLSYSFFIMTSTPPIKQTQAYLDFTKLGLGIGKTTGIAYAESPNTKNPQYPYKNIRAFAPAESVEYSQGDGRPQYTGDWPKKGQTYQAPKHPITPNTAPQTPSRDFEAEAKGKVRHAFLLEAYKQGKQLNSQLLQEINGWTEVVMTGEMPEAQSLSINDMPPFENEIQVEDIGF